MKERFPAPIEEDTRKLSTPLAERMDPAIGEATSVMGTVMTELLRRTLRGGVMKIGEELDDYVHEKVGETIQDQRPVIENLAVEAADRCARIAATEVATEEVKALESRTQDADRDLAARIEETDRALTTRIDDTDKGLGTRIEETGRQATQETQETAQRLASQIEETEKRVQVAFHSELSRQLQEIAERGRKGKAALEERLQAMDQMAAGLGKQLAGEQEERRATHSALQTDLEQRAAALREQLEHEGKDRRAAEDLLRQELARARDEGEARMRRELDEMRQETARGQEEVRAQLREELDKLLEANRSLRRRVTELEKPRGLRALWAWIKGLFGKRKSAPDPEEADAETLTV